MFGKKAQSVLGVEIVRDVWNGEPPELLKTLCKGAQGAMVLVLVAAADISQAPLLTVGFGFLRRRKQGGAVDRSG